MKLSTEEVKKALEISKIIQKRIEITGSTNLRSTDIFPYLVKKGIFPKDRHNGVLFRKFLNKMAKYGELHSLIPQCTRIKPLEGEVFSEWYFHDAKDKMPKPKYISSKKLNEDEVSTSLNEIELFEMNIEEATDIVKMLIAGVNPITEVYLDGNDVCMHPKVSEALEIIINPDSYDVYKIREKATKKSLALNKEIWFNETRAEILEWPSDISENVNSVDVENIRKLYPRAYEKWTDREKDILSKANKLFNDKIRISKLLQRTEGSISSMLNHIEIPSAKETSKQNQLNYLSATALGKMKEKRYQDVISTMINMGYIENANVITYNGKEKGLKFNQKSNGNKWIVYPESLAELL